jgi:hypothetical protein
MTDPAPGSFASCPHHFEYDDADDVERCIYCDATTEADR